MTSSLMGPRQGRPLLLADPPSTRVPSWRAESRADAAVRALRAMARVFIAVGLVDLFLNLFPAAIGNSDWEFGILGPTLDGLPLLTIGLAAGVAAGIWRGDGWTLRVYSIFLWGIVLGLLSLIGLYALSLPIVWKAAGPAGVRGPMTLAVGKTAFLAICYPVLYGWLAILAWRQAGTGRVR